MTERLQQPHGSGRRTASRRTARFRARHAWAAPTIPPAGSEPTILGFPAEVPLDAGPMRPPAEGLLPPDPPSAVALTVVRRSEPVGAGALVLAGVAANVSLSLSWAPGEGPTGLSLVQRGGEALDAGIAESVRTGVWEPLVVVLCGGLLVLLGFLMLVPARAHRMLGVLALVVALAATAAVLHFVADGGWRIERFGPGTWCAVAVAALGVLGALKAMLTPPFVTLDPAEPSPS